MSRAAKNFIKKKRVVRPLYLPSLPKRLTSPLDQGMYLLDKLNTVNIDLYKKAHEQLKEYFLEEHFYFAAERAKREVQILDALNQKTTNINFNGYFRCVAPQFAMKPLSSAGSRISRVGGRFNIGSIGAAGNPFPALYIAANATTAKSEFFQKDPTGSGGISLEDLMQGSVVVSRVHGELSNIIDITNSNNLKPFLKVISKIDIDDNLTQKALKVGLSSPTPAVKAMKELDKALSSINWRDAVVRFDIPSNSQCFGELVKKAKIEGIVYESRFGGDRCLAIFPENLSVKSFVELSDPVAPGVIKKLDLTSFPNLI